MVSLRDLSLCIGTMRTQRKFFGRRPRRLRGSSTAGIAVGIASRSLGEKKDQRLVLARIALIVEVSVCRLKLGDGTVAGYNEHK